MAKELTIEDIRDVFIGALEPFAGAIHDDFKNVNLRFDKIESDVADVKKVVMFDLPEIKQKVEEMKENSHAIFTKLDKYISLYETQRQEFAIMNDDVHKLKERVAKLEVELGKQ